MAPTISTETADPFGEAILRELAPARRFSEWMHEVIEPYLGTRILEIGSGIGTISRQMPIRERLTLSDMNPRYREILARDFAGNPAVDVRKVDLTDDRDFAGIAGAYDSVVCLNVLEHIEDDLGALERMARALRPGGRLIILVPQYPFLMSEMDRLLGHFRRYTRAGLRQKFEHTGFTVERVFNFNSLGTLGWLVNNRLLGKTSLGENKVRLFDRTVPVLRRAERILPLPGLSVIGVAVKPDDSA
jgi:SAM-dependent methyltransferase